MCKFLWIFAINVVIFSIVKSKSIEFDSCEKTSGQSNIAKFDKVDIKCEGIDDNACILYSDSTTSLAVTFKTISDIQNLTISASAVNSEFFNEATCKENSQLCDLKKGSKNEWKHQWVVPPLPPIVVPIEFTFADGASPTKRSCFSVMISLQSKMKRKNL
ncbi:unnamed protein product [Gordionus sp. m RMFG-2023]|uniref:uncharacterized protein LOC135929655 n=1 Tax=Gordionus sp. m RMFG-2023 TaxID=3053472 RepID=UPI0030E2F73B